MMMMMMMMMMVVVTVVIVIMVVMMIRTYTILCRGITESVTLTLSLRLFLWHKIRNLVHTSSMDSRLQLCPVSFKDSKIASITSVG